MLGGHLLVGHFHLEPTQQSFHLQLSAIAIPRLQMQFGGGQALLLVVSCPAVSGITWHGGGLDLPAVP